MNLAEILRGLWRRWYILVPGIILACVVAVAGWLAVSSEYTRTATQLLIPSSGSFAPNTGNPFLNLGGLSQAADVLVDGLNADDVAGKIADENPGATVIVSRDWSNSGPSVLFTVTARSDGQAGEVLRDIVDQTAVVLNTLQDKENIKPDFRIKSLPITFDSTSKISDKKRMTVAAGGGIGVIVFVVLLAAIVDGVSRRRGVRGRGRGRRASAADSVVLSADDGDFPIERLVDGSWDDQDTRSVQTRVAAPEGQADGPDMAEVPAREARSERTDGD